MWENGRKGRKGRDNGAKIMIVCSRRSHTRKTTRDPLFPFLEIGVISFEEGRKRKQMWAEGIKNPCGSFFLGQKKGKSFFPPFFLPLVLLFCTLPVYHPTTKAAALAATPSHTPQQHNRKYRYLLLLPLLSFRVLLYGGKSGVVQWRRWQSFMEQHLEMSSNNTGLHITRHFFYHFSKVPCFEKEGKMQKISGILCDALKRGREREESLSLLLLRRREGEKEEGRGKVGQQKKERGEGGEVIKCRSVM